MLKVRAGLCEYAHLTIEILYQARTFVNFDDRVGVDEAPESAPENCPFKCYN